VWGSTTISPGDTLIELARFLTALGLFAIATATAIDRRRAELLLFVLLGVSTCLVLVLTIHNGGGFFFLGDIKSTGPRAAIALSASIAAVLSLTVVVYATERFETRHSRPEFSLMGYLAALTGGVVGFFIALVTVALFMSQAQLLATLMGVAAFLLIIGFRRAGVPAKFGLLIPAVVIGIPSIIAAQRLIGGSTDIALRFASGAPAPLTQATARIIGDLGWLGSGAGTFGDIVPLYADISQPTDWAAAPTSISASIIGFGHPLTWIFLGGALLAIVKLVYGALNRGRDSFFTAAAASCLVAAVIEAFIDTGLFQSTTLILIAAVLGLGVAQSTSRSSHY
jgi:hypothetical protein